MAFLFPKGLIPASLFRFVTTINHCCNKVEFSRTMSSGPSQRMFQLKFDHLTGKSEWIVIEEEETLENSQQPLLATTSYLDMLNDSRRNRAFREAIEMTVTGPCHVLDIGAGTGLLSMMAARAMSSVDSIESSGTKGTVTACESYLPMVKLMRKVLRVNGMERNIKVINKRSDELKVGEDIPSRADVLVTEILDSELLGEGLIPTLQHAHDVLLVENPRTVPYRATTYGQLVESKFLWKLHDLYNNEEKLSDGFHIVPDELETILHVKSQQAMHCDAIKDEIKLLSEPFKIFEFDFWKRPDSHGKTELCIRATGDGRINAVISWWVLQLDLGGTIFYSTAPKWISFPFTSREMEAPHHSEYGYREWCDHWKQCVWLIPGTGVSISKDEHVHFQAIHTETSISYKLKTQAWRPEREPYDFDAKDCRLTLSPERVAMYGDSEWRNIIATALRNNLQERFPSLCVVADDSFFMTTMVAHFAKALHIMPLFPGVRDKGAQYLRALADTNCFSMENITILDGTTTCFTVHKTNQIKVDLLIGEPFYYGTDGMLPWQNLRFWKERSMLDSILSEDVIIMPCKGILRACAMSLPDLWNSRRCLDRIEGFDHSVVNATLGAAGASQENYCLPFSVWQCGEIQELSKIFTVMEFDFTKTIHPCSGKAKVNFTKHGICHGFVLWIDWVMDAENANVLSTGPDHRYWKQGVKLLANPMAVGLSGFPCRDVCCSAVIEAAFDPTTGEVTVKELFSRELPQGTAQRLPVS